MRRNVTRKNVIIFFVTISPSFCKLRWKVGFRHKSTIPERMPRERERQTHCFSRKKNGAKGPSEGPVPYTRNSELKHYFHLIILCEPHNVNCDIVENLTVFSCDFSVRAGALCRHKSRVGRGSSTECCIFQIYRGSGTFSGTERLILFKTKIFRKFLALSAFPKISFFPIFLRNLKCNLNMNLVKTVLFFLFLHGHQNENQINEKEKVWPLSCGYNIYLGPAVSKCRMQICTRGTTLKFRQKRGENPFENYRE